MGENTPFSIGKRGTLYVHSASRTFPPKKKIGGNGEGDSFRNPLFFQQTGTTNQRAVYQRPLYPCPAVEGASTATKRVYKTHAHTVPRFLLAHDFDRPCAICRIPVFETRAFERTPYGKTYFSTTGHWHFIIFSLHQKRFSPMKTIRRAVVKKFPTTGTSSNLNKAFLLGTQTPQKIFTFFMRTLHQHTRLIWLAKTSRPRDFCTFN